MPEATCLVVTIEKRWPEIHGFLQLGTTNACIEGCHRVIKQSKHVAGGIRNQDNYKRCILLQSAVFRAA